MLAPMADPDERALRDETAALLRELLRLDTSNPPGNETPAALLLNEYVQASGVECELVARDPARANLIARIPGTGDGPSLALLGHTDVVPADPAGWRHPPFAGHLDADAYVWGRGAVDMKNETASRAVAMAVLSRAGFRPRGDLMLVAEADEEDGAAEVGLSWLVRERPDIAADYVLNEGASERLTLADGRTVVTINVGEKATLPALVTALGHAAHASTPESGANAVPRLAALISRLAAHRPAHRLLPETAALLEALVGTVDGDLDGAIERARSLHPRSASSSGRCSRPRSPRPACTARPPATSCPRARASSATAGSCPGRRRTSSRPSCAPRSGTTSPTT